LHGVAFIDEHLRDPTSHPEAKLHLADIDIAVEDRSPGVLADIALVTEPCPESQHQEQQDDG
jgi:hypothetical protein